MENSYNFSSKIRQILLYQILKNLIYRLSNKTRIEVKFIIVERERRKFRKKFLRSGMKVRVKIRKEELEETQLSRDECLFQIFAEY